MLGSPKNFVRPLVAVLVVVVVVGALGACSNGDHAHDDLTATASASGAGGEQEDAPPPFSEEEATTKVAVTLQDYAFVGLPETVTGPNVWFVASIKGSNAHELEILDADGDAVDEIVAFKGTTAQTLAVVLPAGTYTAQCLVKEGSRTHAQLGMKKSFTVI